MAAGRPRSPAVTIGPALPRWTGLVLLLGSGLLLGLLITTAAATAAAAPAAEASSAAADGEDEDDLDLSVGYESHQMADSARVRFLDGDLSIQHADEETVEIATINAPIFSGDIVETQARARAEVQLPSGVIVRLDEGTRMNFLSIPEAGGSSDEATVLQLSSGAAQVEIHRELPRKADFRIDTPSASIYLLASGRYRIDVEGRYERSRVSVSRGVAEVVGDDGSVVLRSGQRTFVEKGEGPDTARAFNTATVGDTFDGWVLDRSGLYLRAANDEDAYEDPEDEAIPDPVRPYRAELSHYGTWTTIPSYGVCWIPSGVAAGWRPYSHGYWVNRPSGYFWVSYDPWGWAPYHYGRWFWAAGRGWVWVPGSVFSGAWVSWYYGPSYVGWCPLDFWDTPSRIGFGPSPWIDYRCWNFVTYRNIYVRNVHRTYVPTRVVRSHVTPGVGVFVRRPVRLRPRDVIDGRVRPIAVVQRARSFGEDVRIDPASDRSRSRRSFRQREQEAVTRSFGERGTAGATSGAGDRRRREGVRRGSAGDLGTTSGPAGRRAPGAPPSARPRGRAVEVPRTPPAERAPRGRSPRHERSREETTIRPEIPPASDPARVDLLPARPRESYVPPSARGRSRATGADRRERSLEEAQPPPPRQRIAPDPDAAPRVPRGELRARPRRQDADAPGDPHPDRSLREFFRESERRPEPQANPEERGRERPRPDEGAERVEQSPRRRSPEASGQPRAPRREQRAQPPERARSGGGKPSPGRGNDGGKAKEERKEKPRQR